MQAGRTYPRRILAADDDPVVREFLALYLALDGVEVDILEDGSGVIDKLAHGYDVLVLDLEMPVMSGFDVLRALQDVPPANRPAVVVLTSRTDTAAIAQAFDLGASAYVLKPIAQTTLKAKISAVYMTAGR